MENNLEINTKLFGFNGIIGRRDFFLNGIIIASIGLFFVIPFHLWTFSHIQTLNDLLNFNKIFLQSPMLLKIWFLSGTLGTFILFASNIYRRLNDINGKNNVALNVFVIFLFLASHFYLILPFIISCITTLTGVIAGLILLFKRGKITGNYPYDYTKDFNWGAYIGTWLWGLFNKSYKTLWILLLGFTPWGPYYQLYCGLKGNEWAFKNKQWNDVEAFNKSQEKQSTIFAILFLVGLPIIYFIIVFGVMYFCMNTIFNPSNPQKSEQAMLTIEDKLSKFGSLYFEAHLITDDENKYYVHSSDWKGYSFKDKKDILAASLAAMERRKEHDKKYPKSYKSFSKQSELKRTKIYSSETKHLLGEFRLDDESLDNGNFKDFVKASLNAYKFYNE